MKGKLHCKPPAIRNEARFSRIEHKTTYRVNPEKDITKEYSEKYPTSPYACIEAVKEIGGKNSSKNHSLDYDVLSTQLEGSPKKHTVENSYKETSHPSGRAEVVR